MVQLLGAGQALQDDGWWLRSDIIWSKPNPMPSSVEDRPGTAHEYVFLFTKSARYFYDASAVREPSKSLTVQHPNALSFGREVNEADRPGQTATQHRPKRKKTMKITPLSGAHGSMGHDGAGHRYDSVYNNPAGRNMRSVWTIASARFPGSHFATFPPELVLRCVKAGTSERGVCPECGTPLERVVEKQFHPQQDVSEDGCVRQAQAMDPSSGWGGAPRGLTATATAGWKPSCACGVADTVPATILDPFGGSGTVARVCWEQRRKSVLIELSPNYCAMAVDRIQGRAVSAPVITEQSSDGQLSLLEVS